MNSLPTADLVQKKCSYCGASELVLDRYTLVCSKCGTVIEEDYYDYYYASYSSYRFYEQPSKRKKPSLNNFSQHTIIYSIIKNLYGREITGVDDLVKLLDNSSYIKEVQDLLKKPCLNTILKRLTSCEKKIAIEIVLDLIKGDYFYPFILSQKCNTKREIARSITKKIYKCISEYDKVDKRIIWA